MWWGKLLFHASRESGIFLLGAGLTLYTDREKLYSKSHLLLGPEHQEVPSHQLCQVHPRWKENKEHN